MGDFKRLDNTVGCIGIIAVIIVLLSFISSSSHSAEPPALNAPLMTITHWCDGQSKESHTVGIPGKGGHTVTTYNPETFRSCLKGYGYTLTKEDEHE